MAPRGPDAGRSSWDVSGLPGDRPERALGGIGVWSCRGLSFHSNVSSRQKGRREGTRWAAVARVSEMLTHGSLFAGIGGFDLGFQRAGFKTLWQVEIDGFCRKVLRKRFPRARRFKNVETAGKHNLSAVDVLAGGFPCQGLSVAGRRKGLADARSRLFYEFVRIADEMLPRWLVVENVPGLLSSPPEAPGRDMHNVLGELTGCWPAIPEEGGWRNSGVCVGPKRSLAWGVLDSRYFGVAQRRRRVFFVAGPRIESAWTVLFDAESVSRNIATGGE